MEHTGDETELKSDLHCPPFFPPTDHRSDRLPLLSSVPNAEMAIVNCKKSGSPMKTKSHGNGI